MYAKNFNSAKALTLLPLVSEPAVQERSRIPEIRTGLRRQVKLLRSTSIALMLAGLWASVMVWIAAEPFKAEMTIFDYYIMGLICIGILIVSAVLTLIIQLSANEVEDQTRRLNKEV